jgi:hypothetical protein
MEEILVSIDIEDVNSTFRKNALGITPLEFFVSRDLKKCEVHNMSSSVLAK